jgi:putative hydroxymethylpyrimidine transport system permease protein
LITRGAITVLFGLCVWQLLILLFHFPPYILPGPLLVLQSFVQNFDLILVNALPTIIETLSGLCLGVILGILLASLMQLWPPIGFWLLPLLILSQAIPTFTFAPILVLWFGYGMFSKIVTIAIMLFFPVASSFYDGLKRTPAEWLDLAKTMNGKKLKIFLHLQLPAALPNVASGLRIATVLAPLGAIVSEWVGASKGLGFLMLNANARLEIALMFACVITIMILSLSLYGLVNGVLKRVVW